MREQELIQEAKERYPKGTKYINSSNGNNYIVEVDSSTYTYYLGNIWSDAGKGCLYHQSYGWCKILTNEYPIF